jgi:4-hydroxybenzoate polyprenyltransferase
MKELQILCSIIILSIAGAFKLEFAYEFLGKNAKLEYLISILAITYSVYAFDRGIKNKEDDDYRKSFRYFLLGTSLVSIFLAIYVSMNLLLVIPFVVAYLYSKGIKNFRLKCGMGVKNLVVAFTWSLVIVILVGDFSYTAFVVYSFFFLKSFVNTVVYDFKDVERDRRAGIRTLPVCIDVNKLRLFLFSINVIGHAVAMLMIRNLIILLSLANSTLYIFQCKCNKRPNDILVDGEWILYRIYKILFALAL